MNSESNAVAMAAVGSNSAESSSVFSLFLLYVVCFSADYVVKVQFW